MRVGRVKGGKREEKGGVGGDRKSGWNGEKNRERGFDS